MRLTTSVAIILLGSTTAVLGQPTYLEQGWTANEREEFYFTPQGSQLIPFDWFLALEQHNSNTLFRDNSNMQRYGIVTAEVSKRNPNGLPVGFVRDAAERQATGESGPPSRRQRLVESARKFGIKKSYLGSAFQEKFYPKKQTAWFGLTCAACHTHELDYDGKTIRIDGGSTQADLESFLRDLGLALTATHKDGEKLRRFSDAIGRSRSGRDTLKEEVKQLADAVNRLVARNKVDHPYGHARLDAFGAILNAVCETALDEPANHRPSDAPVSYPSLWNTPHMSHVQWAATADRPEKRNVGEVLGVFGHFSLAPETQFQSTVNLRNLITIEHKLLADLKSPDWPEEILGKLDAQKVRRGRVLFQKNCQSCHPVRGRNGKFALNTADRIQAISNTLDELGTVGTDPQFLKNLTLEDTVLTGDLAPLFNGQERMPRLAVLAAVVKGITAVRAKVERVDMDETDPGPQPDPHPKGMGSGYISRPLEGIWANAPYFHNGSVPNLYETLLPASERTATFTVGARKFDPRNVGFVIDAAGGSKFRVTDDTGKPIIGNSNAGHEGHGMSPKMGFTQTFEDGKWRDFTKDERYALVEYMKSLSSSPMILEEDPQDEAKHIARLVEITAKRMQQQYSGKRMLRGVHPKDHGCVTAKFEVLSDLPHKYTAGVFQPGAVYDAYVRFSNASIVKTDDSPLDPATGKRAHGSRGMAVKLMGVDGDPLMPLHGALTQDFLMVNQPGFAFANVRDYLMFNESQGETRKEKFADFQKRMVRSGDPGAIERLKETGRIVTRISALSVAEGAFERPPASPVDATYYAAAPFLFGNDHVMKYRVKPVNRSCDEPDVDDPSYLRKALIKRLKDQTIVFEFQIQLRNVADLDVATDIENASIPWDDKFRTVARLTIPSQEFDSPEHREKCERLFFTPWHGIVEHAPLGGINRLRKAVYEGSARHRSLPKEQSSTK